MTKSSEDGKVEYFYQGEQCFLKPFYAFESVSMFAKDINTPPSSSHIILFFTIELTQPSSDIALALQPGEIDAAVWLPLDSLEKLLLKETVPGESSIEGISVSASEEHVLAKFDLELLRPPYPNEHLEGISKAHNFALRYFLRMSKEAQETAKL